MRRHLHLLTACLLLIACLPVHAAIHTLKPDAPPEVVRSATGTVEVGTLAGTQYRIDIPADWNHALIVYFHGYAETPYTYRAHGPLSEQTAPMFERGYAIIQSAYSTTGWALAEAYPETEQLRLYFLKQYGRQAEGRTAARNPASRSKPSSSAAAWAARWSPPRWSSTPNPTVAASAFCGSVGPSDLAFQRRFAWRAAFDFYFPGLLPSPVPAPVAFEETPAERTRWLKPLRNAPAAATALRNLTGLHTDREVADAMVYFTYVLADMAHRAGGNRMTTAITSTPAPCPACPPPTTA